MNFNRMISITKDQAAYIRTKYKDISIPQTCKQKSKSRRHKRSIEDTKNVRNAIKEFTENTEKVIYTYPTK